jgi:hypothetical protein
MDSRSQRRSNYLCLKRFFFDGAVKRGSDNRFKKRLAVERKTIQDAAEAAMCLRNASNKGLNDLLFTG